MFAFKICGSYEQNKNILNLKLLKKIRTLSLGKILLVLNKKKCIYQVTVPFEIQYGVPDIQSFLSEDDLKLLVDKTIQDKTKAATKYGVTIFEGKKTINLKH